MTRLAIIRDVHFFYVSSFVFNMSPCHLSLADAWPDVFKASLSLSFPAGVILGPSLEGATLACRCVFLWIFLCFIFNYVFTVLFVALSSSYLFFF